MNFGVLSHRGMAHASLMLSFLLCGGHWFDTAAQEVRKIDRLTFQADFAILYLDGKRNLKGRFGYHDGTIRIDWTSGRRIVWFLRRGDKHVTYYPDEHRSEPGWEALGVDHDAAGVILQLAKEWYQYQNELVDGNLEPLRDFELSQLGKTRINGMECRIIRYASRQNVDPPLTLYSAVGFRDLLVRFDLRRYPDTEGTAPVAFELTHVSKHVGGHWFEPPQPN